MLRLARIIRLASISICLVVSASFLVFALNQTSSASARQQRELAGTQATAPPGPAQSTGESGLQKALDDVAKPLTSPFSGAVSSSGEWAARGVKFVLTLLVYGFGLGYVARVLRVRA